jgi:IgA peptidase M64
MTKQGVTPRLRRGSLLLVVALTVASGRSSAIERDLDFVSDHLAGPPVILHGSGAADTLNIVILGDGFTSDDASMSVYRNAADRLVAELVSTDPYAVVSNAMTFYRLDVISNERGIDVPNDCAGQSYDLPPPPEGQGPFALSRAPKNPDNVLDTHWCAVDVLTGAGNVRFLGSDTDRVPLFANAAGVTPDITIVLVNDWMFGATAYPDDAKVFVSISENHVEDKNPDTGELNQPNNAASFPRVVVHELGHVAPFNLVEEKPTGHAPDESPSPEATAAINASPNLDSKESPLKWEGLVDPATPRPTDCEQQNPPEVGAAKGGYTYAKGVYRARCWCTMRTWVYDSFCIVCRQRILQGLEPHLPLVNYQPPRKEPSPIPGKPDPGAMWVILDELAVKSGPSGSYSIEYSISAGESRSPAGERSVSGIWPRERRVNFNRGRTVQIDDLLTIVPSNWLTGSSGLTVSYRLVWHPSLGNSAGASQILAQENWQLPLIRLKSGIVALDRPTHRLTLALLRPH